MSETPVYCETGCGALAEVAIEDADDATGYRGERFFCLACLEKRLEQCR